MTWKGCAARRPLRCGEIRIEDGAWWGAGVIVVPGATIGAGTVVAAGSAVTRDLPADVLAGGVLAYLIRSSCAERGGSGFSL
ncbi:acyltransferase [Brachybacterium saurashtrense]|uniref:acyltransferase n=1 Tax=Brachybacterium saurashtrense TaxID=556288 RepID=UPI002407A040|nr:hypothetical protein [Brachybacterium saurashtrense]